MRCSASCGVTSSSIGLANPSRVHVSGSCRSKGRKNGSPSGQSSGRPQAALLQLMPVSSASGSHGMVSLDRMAGVLTQVRRLSGANTKMEGNVKRVSTGGRARLPSTSESTDKAAQHTARVTAEAAAGPPLVDAARWSRGRRRPMVTLSSGWPWNGCTLGSDTSLCCHAWTEGPLRCGQDAHAPTWCNTTTCSKMRDDGSAPEQGVGWSFPGRV